METIISKRIDSRHTPECSCQDYVESIIRIEGYHQISTWIKNSIKQNARHRRRYRESMEKREKDIKRLKTL